MTAAPLGAVTVTVNGEARSFDDGATVADLVAAVAPSPKGIAVAVNADLVPRSAWAATPLTDRDRIELLTAAQGG
jgi:sulfur carrier protein